MSEDMSFPKSENKYAVEYLKSRKLKVATAESCTAGMISKSITDVSGSSSVFEMGVSAYSNEIKKKILSVPTEILEKHTAVSAETAAYMALGVLKASGADLGISTTGVAGPSPSDGKPVGCVFIGMTDGENFWIRQLGAYGVKDRDKIRRYATETALNMISLYAENYPRPLPGGSRDINSLLVHDSNSEFIPALPISDGSSDEIPQDGSEIPTDNSEIENTEINEKGETARKNNETDESVTQTYEGSIFKEMSDNNQNSNGRSEEFLSMIFDTPEEETAGPEEVVMLSQTAAPDSVSTDFIADTVEEKSPWYKRLAKYFIPWKGDPVGEIIRKIVFLAALTVFICAGVYLINYMAQGSINSGLIRDARTIYDINNDERNSDGMFTRFEELYKQNSDIRGWITIDGTKIDYPVYQAEDNDYYIDHDMSKQESRYGAVFADCKAKLEKEGNSRNVVLYGHNMIDGSMFSQLLDYKNLDFYRSNPLISFDTLYNEGDYKIFAVFIINADEKEDDGYAFNYRKNVFPEGSSFERFITEVNARSIIDTGIDVVEGDELLTLSTCSYEFDDARTVVMARKVRENESLHVATSEAKLNKTPLYPQAYYDKYGGKKPKLDFDYSDTNGVEVVSSNALEGYSGPGDKIYTADDIIKEDETLKEKVEVGTYVGLSLNTAIGIISNDGLYVESVEYDGSDENLNTVLTQSLKSGKKVTKGSGIVLSVSGKPVKITVPNLVGMNEKDATKKATDSGLTLSFIMVASNKKSGTVLMQSLTPTTVTEERSMVVYMSNGQNKIPNTVGMSVKKATKAFEKEGFKIKINYVETVNKKQIGVVCSQSPVPGEFAKLGSKITVTVGKKSTKDPYDNNPDIEDRYNEGTDIDNTISSTESKSSSSKDKDSSKTSSSASSKVSSSAASSKPIASNPSSAVSSSVSSAASSEAATSSTASNTVPSAPSDTTSSDTAPTESTVTSSQPESENQ